MALTWGCGVVVGAETRPAETQAADEAANPGEQLPGQVKARVFDPEPIRVTLEGLPEPFASESASKSPEVIGPGEVEGGPVLEVPAGFRVQVFAEVDQARWLALTPEGDVLCVSSRTNTIYLLRDEDCDGVAEWKSVFADEENGLNLPFGMAFFNGHFYVGNTNAVVRWVYRSRRVRWTEAKDDLEVREPQRRIEGKPEVIAELPGQGYNQHWTRNVVIPRVGLGGGVFGYVANEDAWMYVTVGSQSNVNVEDPPRASILRMRPDGSEREVYASGLRNPVGLASRRFSQHLYATVNERDGLGDQLVPDYLVRVERGGFYGWPYAYLSPENLDPRRMKGGKSERPDLAGRTITPEVLFESHSAALGLAIYPNLGGEEDFWMTPAYFPRRYREGAFVALRGSWNRSRGTGYKIVFVPFDEEGRPLGYYEDFVRGFLVEPKVPRTWGRPVGVLVADDGALLFTDEANGLVYRVTHEDSDLTPALRMLFLPERADAEGAPGTREGGAVEGERQSADADHASP